MKLIILKAFLLRLQQRPKRYWATHKYNLLNKNLKPDRVGLGRREMLKRTESRSLSNLRQWGEKAQKVNQRVKQFYSNGLARALVHLLSSYLGCPRCGSVGVFPG